ncbi:MAG TPA: gephyrin-like molybdotransferase Glp [Rhizomicrobium sp.]|nr:gephyrin-like molybdotransferase Glp [Rhizomicrobium sp.]
MISVDEAVARVVAAFKPLAAEQVGIGDAAGRILAKDATARLTQPPAPVSAMDGYAVRAADAATVPVSLKVIGSAPAGHPFDGRVGKGEAVRIFTGGVVPEGADTIVIQEDTEAGSGTVLIKESPKPNRHIRVAGLDFKQGDTLLRAGHRLSARDTALLAAADIAKVPVHRKPRVLIAATGDELSRPGEPHRPGGIVASSVYGLCAQVDKWGGIPHDIGILPDRADSIAGIASHAKDADVIVTLGGASVGDHDLVQKALGPKGFVLDFWKIAMRPGKPLIFGHLDGTPLLGLPGNPVSSYVCALLFLKPAIAAMLGETTESSFSEFALTADLPNNDSRQDYIRARLIRLPGQTQVEPLPVQDSSMQRALAEADALIVRQPHAPATSVGDKVKVILLD